MDFVERLLGWAPDGGDGTFAGGLTSKTLMPFQFPLASDGL